MGMTDSVKLSTVQLEVVQWTRKHGSSRTKSTIANALIRKGVAFRASDGRIELTELGNRIADNNPPH